MLIVIDMFDISWLCNILQLYLFYVFIYVFIFIYIFYVFNLCLS